MFSNKQQSQQYITLFVEIDNCAMLPTKLSCRPVVLLLNPPLLSPLGPTGPLFIIGPLFMTCPLLAGPDWKRRIRNFSLEISIMKCGKTDDVTNSQITVVAHSMKATHDFLTTLI